jgi:hypothetical protein
MPYVKISDPNIIDISAWHQVINVINQHSDSISSITNNFGIEGSSTIDWNGESDYVNQYDPGSQKTLYGRNKVVTANLTPAPDSYNKVFYGSVSFVSSSGSTKFAQAPNVVASIRFNHSSIDTLKDKSHNIILNVFAVTDTGFSYRLTRANSNPDSATPVVDPFDTDCFITWTAIGPK